MQLGPTCHTPHRSEAEKGMRRTPEDRHAWQFGPTPPPSPLGGKGEPDPDKAAAWKKSLSSLSCKKSRESASESFVSPGALLSGPGEAALSHTMHSA